jgi:hypothetical protein
MPAAAVGLPGATQPKPQRRPERFSCHAARGADRPPSPSCSVPTRSSSAPAVARAGPKPAASSGRSSSSKNPHAPPRPATRWLEADTPATPARAARPATRRRLGGADDTTPGPTDTDRTPPLLPRDGPRRRACGGALIPRWPAAGAWTGEGGHAHRTLTPSCPTSPGAWSAHWGGHPGGAQPGRLAPFWGGTTWQAAPRHIGVDATPQRAWQVLTGFAASPDWNRFVTRASATARRAAAPARAAARRVWRRLRPAVLEPTRPAAGLAWPRAASRPVRRRPRLRRRTVRRPSVRFGQPERFRGVRVPLAPPGLTATPPRTPTAQPGAQTPRRAPRHETVPEAG